LPLRRKDKGVPTKYQSIVIFTTDPHAADRCIKRGIYIDYRLYPAEKYTPQLQITHATIAANTDIEQLTANTKHAAGNVLAGTRQKTATTPANPNAAIAAANTKTGITNAQHELLSPVGLKACGGNSHLTLPPNGTRPLWSRVLWSIRPNKATEQFK
jgi:hypothetical protein